MYEVNSNPNWTVSLLHLGGLVTKKIFSYIYLSEQFLWGQDSANSQLNSGRHCWSPCYPTPNSRENTPVQEAIVVKWSFSTHGTSSGSSTLRYQPLLARSGSRATSFLLRRLKEELTELRYDFFCLRTMRGWVVEANVMEKLIVAIWQ
jgi:hypothetical protein